MAYRLHLVLILGARPATAPGPPPVPGGKAGAMVRLLRCRPRAPKTALPVHATVAARPVGPRKQPRALAPGSSAATPPICQGVRPSPVVVGEGAAAVAAVTRGAMAGRGRPTAPRVAA